MDVVYILNGNSFTILISCPKSPTFTTRWSSEFYRKHLVASPHLMLLQYPTILRSSTHLGWIRCQPSHSFCAQTKKNVAWPNPCPQSIVVPCIIIYSLFQLFFHMFTVVQIRCCSLLPLFPAFPNENKNPSRMFQHQPRLQGLDPLGRLSGRHGIHHNMGSSMDFYLWLYQEYDDVNLGWFF